MVHKLVNIYIQSLRGIYSAIPVFMGFEGAKLKCRPGQPTLQLRRWQELKSGVPNKILFLASNQTFLHPHRPWTCVAAQLSRRAGAAETKDETGLQSRATKTVAAAFSKLLFINVPGYEWKTIGMLTVPTWQPQF